MYVNVKDISCQGEFPDIVCVTLLDGGCNVVDEWDYVPERTCKAVKSASGWNNCSECDAVVGYMQAYTKYCPNCGAKVVE